MLCATGELGLSQMFDPPHKFDLPLLGEKRSNKITWYMSVQGSKSQPVDNKPGIVVYVYTDTHGHAPGRSIGLKAVLILFDDTNTVILERRGYYGLSKNTVYSGNIANWSIQLDDIPLTSASIKLCCTYLVYDVNNCIMPVYSSSRGKHVVAFDRKPMLEYTEDLALMLDKDRVAGVTTDAVLKHRDEEYKVHKCVLSLQSDFFKARFGDQSEVKNGADQTVDLNDPDLNPVVLEALISGAYTGKVENFDVALELLPVTESYKFLKLKGVCELAIGSNLTRSNVLRCYEVAVGCNALKLRKKCESLLVLGVIIKS